MIKLVEGKAIRREIRVHGVEAPVNVAIFADGLTFWIRGSKKKITVRWEQVIQSAPLDLNVPAFLMNKPLKFLNWLAAKRQRQGGTARIRERSTTG